MTDHTQAPLEVIAVGLGERARAWRAVVDASPRLRLVCEAAHVDEVAAALVRHPAAVVMGVLAPRAGGGLVDLLARERRRGVVQAPVMGLAGEPWHGVRIAFGFATLPGLHWLARINAVHAPRAVTIEVCGAPESSDVGLDVALPHALAAALYLWPSARITGATRVEDEQLRVVMDADGIPVTVAVSCGPRSISIACGGPDSSVRLEWRPDGERRHVARGGESRVSEATPRPPEERALAQLLGGPLSGLGIGHAAIIDRWCADVWRMVGRSGASCRRLRATASAMTRGDSGTASVGLRGALPAAVGPVSTLELPEAVPCEVRALRAGRARAVFLTVAPEDVPATLSLLDGLSVDTRTRRVAVHAQDRWDDRRDQGEPRVEIYAAHDAERVAAMVSLQAVGDPSDHVRALGALLGYPPCCVDAFARQSDRANNSYNRYATFARTTGAPPWPWQLNNFITMTVPFFPCRYDCRAAAAYAADVVGPDMRRELTGAALYFTHEHQVMLRGEGEGVGVGEGVGEGEGVGALVCYDAVLLPPWADTGIVPLARALAAGDAALLRDDALVIRAGERELVTLDRTDPHLGVLARFA